MLSVNKGRIINTFIKVSLIDSLLRLESGSSGLEAIKTVKIPKMLKVTEA